MLLPGFLAISLPLLLGRHRMYFGHKQAQYPASMGTAAHPRPSIYREAGTSSTREGAVELEDALNKGGLWWDITR
jgi:hypothetical protein